MYTRNWQVFEHSDGDRAIVKQGFSWPGMFFGWAWAFTKRLWVTALTGVTLHILFLIAVITVLFSPTLLDKEPPFILFIGAIWCIFLIMGLFGNRWRVTRLKVRNYHLIGLAKAKTPRAALEKVLNSPKTESA